MSRHPVSVGGRADAAEYRQELLGRLSLRADASDQEVEAAHNGLVEFLELAPAEVRPWAAAQTADVDEAFALLSGPEQDLVLATQVAASALDGLGATTPAPSPAAAPPLAAIAPTAPAVPGAFAALAANKPLRNKMVWVAVPLLVIAAVSYTHLTLPTKRIV